MINFFYLNKILALIIYCDAPSLGQIGTQFPGTPAFIGMVSFHYYLLIFIVAIGVAVFYVLGYILIFYRAKGNKFHKDDSVVIMKFSHSNELEIIWTIIPAIILLFLAVPSFNLLYSLDDIINPELTVKVVGHQWYWSYEFSDVKYAQNSIRTGKLIDVEQVNFDAYMITEEDLVINNTTNYFNLRMFNRPFRLLETSIPLCLPIHRFIRVLVTSADVLHSWAIPSLGIKIDACPGRLSQVSLYIELNNTYYGQCSEICGVNHGFMPIVIQAIPDRYFRSFLKVFSTGENHLIY